MQVGAYLHVHVDAFLPFSSVAIEGENLWQRGNSLPCLYLYKDNMASVFNGPNLGILSIRHGERESDKYISAQI